MSESGMSESGMNVQTIYFKNGRIIFEESEEGSFILIVRCPGKNGISSESITMTVDELMGIVFDRKTKGCTMNHKIPKLMSHKSKLHISKLIEVTNILGTSKKPISIKQIQKSLKSYTEEDIHKVLYNLTRLHFVCCEIPKSEKGIQKLFDSINRNWDTPNKVIKKYILTKNGKLFYKLVV